MDEGGGVRKILDEGGGVRKILGVGGGDKSRGSDKKDSLQKLHKHLGPVWSVVTINPNMVTFYVC